MFEREHHRRIESVLASLDGDLLLRHHCLFGGGTAIVLSCGEYRESIDIDFMISDLVSYRALREKMNTGLRAVLKPGATLKTTREIRADQYGIRTFVAAHDLEIKLEIVLEARMRLEAATDRLCGVPLLTRVDMAAGKLLANSDRWRDDSVHSRDLIDLAMLQPDKTTLRQARDKATLAYGASIDRDLGAAIDMLRDRRGRLLECMQALRMTDVPQAIPPALLWKRIRGLRGRRAASRR